MKRSIRFVAFLLLVVALTSRPLSNGATQENGEAPAAPAKIKASDAQKSEEGFKSLFNGKDLTGWEGDFKIWSVRDGAITGQTTEEVRVTENNFLIWKGGELADFELRLKYRIVGGNSGIYFHSRKRKPGQKGEALVGPQADFSADGRWTGVVMEYSLRDILAERSEKVVIDEKGNKKVVGYLDDHKKLLAAVKNEEWNDYTVITKGGHTVLKINGVVMCEIQDKDPKRPGTGLLALQVHVGPPMLVQFKDIRLRKL
jgi:hypothetical protein